MASLIAVENVSADFVMQAPGRRDEDTRGGFTRGGWAQKLLAKDPEAMAASLAGSGQTGAMLFGRITYLDLVGRWMTTKQKSPFVELMRVMPKFVASRTRQNPLPYPNSAVLEGEAMAAVAALKNEPRLQGDVVVLGSGNLLRQLIAADLVDQYVLTHLPVTLGEGTKLWDAMPANLEKVASTTGRTGIEVATYQVSR